MAGPQIPKDFRRVIVAAAVGNVIEWYDFYIFGSLAAVLSVKFFEQSNPVAALLSTYLTNAAAITPAGCRPLRLSGSWCRCSGSSRHARISAMKYSTHGRGEFRS